MKIDDYLERIHFQGRVAADIACLKALHRHHLLAIPYEDLDVQLRRPVDLDAERTFDKLVTQGRGGWCYEMNGLFGWALGELGFDVTRMVGAVMRKIHGDAARGNHLVLRVELDEPWLADVGLGDGILDPIPLREGSSSHANRSFRLEPLDDGSWRFHNHVGSIPPSFDFFSESDEALLAATCQRLQDDPDSLFRQNLMCMQPDGERGRKLLLGRVLELPGRERRILEDADAFRETLSSVFGLDDPAFADLWPQVVARHEAVSGN